MNNAHLHLLVNHVAIFGVFFGLSALTWSMVRKNADLRIAAVILFLISGLFAWIATETGEGAEDVVEKLPGIMESLIEEHEEAAEVAYIFTIILAVSSLLMEGVARFKNQWLKFQIIILILALTTTGLLAYTALLGGQIRHTEIRDSGTTQNTESQNHETHDEN